MSLLVPSLILGYLFCCLDWGISACHLLLGGFFSLEKTTIRSVLCPDVLVCYEVDYKILGGSSKV